MLTAFYIVISAIFISVVWKVRKKILSKPGKIPQVEVLEMIEEDAKKSSDYYLLRRGYKLFLCREIINNGSYHLVLNLNTNGRNLEFVKFIIISWTSFKERIFDFKFKVTDEQVEIDDDSLKIDLGSFNNCPSSVNFLHRTINSVAIQIDLLDYVPDIHDYSYEQDIESQCAFFPVYSKNDIIRFSKQSHFIDE